MSWRKLLRSSEFGWRYVVNLGPSLAYRLQREPLAGEAARVAARLNRDGLAISSVDALSGLQQPFEELAESVRELQDERRAEIEARRNNGHQRQPGEKAFVIELLGDRPVLDPSAIYARVALQPTFLQIANAYFEMFTRLRAYNVWHTIPTRAQARHSQLWHRDREDRYILKVFIYLSDVDEAAGPLVYAPGTHRKGFIRREPASFIEDGVRRSKDSDMAEVVPCERWIRCVAGKGSVVFADTHGYHKGGLARDHDRIVYMCMYTSPASESPEVLRRPAGLPAAARREEAVALCGPRRGAWLRLPAVNNAGQ